MKKSILKFGLVFSTVVVMSLLLFGCQQNKNAGNEISTTVVEQTVPSTKESKTQLTTTDVSTTIKENTSDVYVYIGNSVSDFKKYPVDISGEVTPEKLIAEISKLTGWNLDLASEVTMGKGGISVDFSSSSALVIGPPENQKEEFFVYDNFSLAKTILDSIQQTLRKYYVLEGGDEKSLDIWYSLEGKDIKIEDKTISILKPWDEQSL